MFAVAVFTYVEIVLISKVFGNHKGKITALRIFEYFFFAFAFFLFVANLFLVATGGWFFQRADSGTITQQISYQPIYSGVHFSILLMLVLQIPFSRFFYLFFLLFLLLSFLC